MTDSAEDRIAQAEASTQAKLAHDSAQAQTAEQATAQPALAVAEPEETQAQESASTDFDAGTYDMPTQGDAITEQVQNLKAGWADVLPQIGGVLHNQFGLDGVISSAARTPEHNAEVGGAEHSHHIDNGDGGDAVDIVLPDGTTAEQAEQVKQYFENSGAFQEVLFHDAGSGYHLHLGGLKGSLGDAGASAGGGLTLSSGDEQIDAWIQEAADANGVPDNLLSALLDVESGYNVDTPNSEAGAIGIAQFMPGTAEAMGIDPRDPHQAISGAARLLKQEYDHYGNWSQALEAYNGGEGNVGSGETQAYAQKVLGKAGDISHVGGGSRSNASSTNFMNERPSFDINSDDAEGRKMISDFIDYWGNRADVDDADTIQGMLDANGKFRNTQENRDTVREKWGDELQQYADEHMTDEQQAGQETKVQKQAQQQADAARRAAQGGKKAASVDNTKAAIDTSTPNLDAAKQQQVSTTPQATSIDTAGESEQTQAEPAQSLPNTAHLQPNTEHPASETAHPATAAQAKAQQAQPTTQASQPTAQAAPIEQAKAPTVPKNEPQNAQQNSQAPAQPQTPTMDAQQATKQQNALPQPAQTPQQANPQMSPAEQRARAAKEQRLQKELETNATLDQIERGQQLEAAAKQASVALPQGMAGALHRGQPQAIAQTTLLLKEKGVALPTVEASGNTVYGAAETTGRGNSAQNATAPRKVEPAENASGQQMEKPSSKKSTPSRKPVKGKAGKSVTVTTDSGKELHARYRIVPASSLTTSNVYDGDTIAKNDAYPQELQPRERSGRKEMQAQTDGMAADLHPADLEASRNLNQGAPLIRSDGVVLNGNGRTMAITRAYALRNKAGKRYTQYLIEHAEDFGFTKDQMRAAVKAKGTGKPVLVRELTDDVDADTTQEIINSKIGGASMSATEQAEADAKRIKSSDFNDYDQESDGDLTKGSNDGFVSKLLRKLIGKDEANKYTDKNGQVNQDGYRRVKRAIFSRAYGDTDLIAKMAESMDDAIKNISNGLQSSAANVARLNLKMQEGDAYRYPLAKTIAQAVKKYNAIKEGKAEANVEAYANENETSLTGGDPEEVVKMVQALDDFHRSGKKVGTFLNHLADILDHQGSPKEDATAFDFGEASKPLTLSEAIDQAKEKTVTGGEQNLFGAPKYSIEEAKERHERTLADLKREIASAFPGAKNVREDGDRIAFDMPNGSHMEIWTTDNIELSSEEEAQAKRDHGVTGDMHIKVNGYEVTVGKDALVAIAKNGEKGTAYHEVLHIAMDILFNDREKAALAKKFGKGRGTVEEHIAEAFRRYKLAREHGAHVPFGKLFQRIQDFFANLADHYKELRGTMTDADVARRAFRELANGKAWEKKPVDTRSGKADNETKKKFLIDSQKQDLFDSVSKRIQEYVNEQVHDGKSMDDVMKELTSENSTVRDHILARLNALDQTLNHMKTERSQEEKREFVDSHLAERFKKPEGLTDEEVNKLYESFQRTAKELKDYAGILFREISLNRRDHGGELAGMASWRDAENQRDTREAQAKNGAVNHGQHYSVSRSDSQDGFSRAQNPRKYSIAYHGTQHEFDKFDVGKIGRGEGTRVHGWGIYFAKNREVSQKYRDTLAGEPHGVTINGTTYHYEGGNLFTADGKRVDSVPIRLAVDTLVEEGSRKAALERAEGAAVGILDDEGKKNWAAVRDLLKGAKTQFEQDGMLAEANVPEDGVMLDEQKPFDQQPKNVQDAVNSMLKDLEAAYLKKGKEASSRAANGKEELLREGARNIDNNERANDAYENLYFFMDDNGGKTKGQEIYDGLCAIFGGDKNASIALNEYGVKGIKYKGERDGDCYVVFDDKAVSIIRKLSASRAKEAHARAVEDIKAEVLKAFPGAKDVKDTGDRITFTMPNGAKVAIRIHDNMTVTGEEASRARRAHGIADGVTITVNGSAYTIGRQAVIDLSQRGEVGTVYHEALHVAMDLLFDDKTKAALMKKYGSEEKIADAYRKFMLAEARGGHVPFGKPLRAIRDFFRALASHIAPIRKACGDAWTAQKAFEDLASGKAWEPASKKSHGLSLFSHAEAAERPIDNEAARGDNEAKRENQRIEQKNQKVFASVRDAFTKEVQMLRDKGWKESSIIRAMNDENSEYRKRVVEPFARVYNQFHAKGSNKRDVVQRILGEKAFADLMQKNSTRRQEAIAEVFQQLSDRMEGVMNDARKTCIELAYRLGNGQDAAGLHSWRDIEASSRKHGGDAAFTEHPAEVTKTNGQHHSVSRSERQDGFSDAEKQGSVHYSITPEEKKAEAHTRSWFKSLGERFSKAYHLKSDKVINDLEKSEAEKTEAEKQKEQEQLRATDRIHSPHVVASRLKTFRVFYVMGDRAMNKLVSLRNQYSRKLTDAYDLVKDKDDKDALFDLLLRGDTEGKEWKKQELLDEGVKENVADAYIKIRRLMTKAYHMVNNARRHPVPKTENVTQEQLDFIRQSKFTKNIDDVVDLGISSKDHMHHYRVSYTQYRHYERTHENITGDMLAQYRKDPGIDVLDVQEVAADADGRPLYNVKVQEGPADMNRLTGYIPHFFHDYFLRVLDENGKVVATIGSGRTQRDAIIKGEEWLKGHKLAKGQTLHVQPKVFDFGSVGMDEHQYAAVMGDMDFYRMTNALAKENDMTLEEARAMLDGKVRLKGRHRFFGNALHRRGVEGYETDLNWVLTHYFNSASRYAAMETEFKPKAISAFERFFGRFDDDYADNDMARLCKRFINNINGNPSTAEEFISKLLNSTTLFKKYIIPTFGDRSALTLGNGIANKVSYLTLGLNMSSALLNFSQLVNSAAYIGEIGSLVKMVKEGTKRGPSLAKLRDMQKRATSAAEKERIEQQIQERLRRVKILQETGVYNDIGLDSGSGYDQARMGAAAQGRNRFTKALYGINVHMDSLGNKSMFFFQHADAICRRGTVLAAYEKARREGKTHAQAIAYAKEINVKANFIYGVQDTPDLFQRGSIISQLALQFKKFGLKELEVMADFMPDFPGLRKLGSYDNIHLHKYSAKQKAMFWGMFFLMSGLMGVPALDWLDDLFANLLPKAFGTDPHSTKDFFTKLIVENIHNKALAKAMLYGASGVFNINLSSRAGLSDVIPSSMGDFAGPTLSKGARLVKDYNENNWPSMLRDVSPGLYNLYAAGMGESRGKRDRLNDRYVTAWDRILRAVGFRSVDETIPTDMQRIISRDKAAATKERQEAQDAYIQNPTSENKQRLKDLGIKEKDVQKEATKKNQTREERTQGTVPKKDKDKYKSLTDFMKE